MAEVREVEEKKETQGSTSSIWSDDIELYSDPVNDWIAEKSHEWSKKYSGKYLAIIDCYLVAVEDTRKAAYKKLRKLYPERFYKTDLKKEIELEKIPGVLYIPRAEEMEMIL